MASDDGDIPQTIQQTGNTKMRRKLSLISAIVTALVVPIGPAHAAPADFAELLAKLPKSANAIVMLNAQQIFGSEIAVRDGWKQRYDANYADSPLMLPPAAQQFVLAADLDLATLKPRWEAAVLRLADDPSMSMIARTVRGTPDSVGGLDAVATPRGAMLVKFAPRLYGMIQPGSRQSTARWIRDTGSAAGDSLSPYLKTAADVPDQVGTEIIMALDMTDALSRDRVRNATANSEVLKNGMVDLDAAADILSSIQGATLGARVTRRVYGALRIDFSRDVAPIAAVAKPLLLEVLSEAGASIDEFAEWNVQVAPKRISIEGELTASGLRRLFSFLELDATAVHAAPDGMPAPGAGDAAAPSGSQADATAEASLKYYQAVNRHLEDLKRERGASTYASIALWFDKYARRIDRLPILGVDKDLVDYGQFVVINLRNAVDAIRGVGIRTGAQTAGVSSGYSDYYVFDSAVSYASSPMNAARADVSAAEAQRRAIRATEKAQGTTDARGLMRIITDKQSEIRRQMTERYMIEFGAAPR